METWMTSFKDQPEGKCFVIILVSDHTGSNAVQNLEAKARFLGCGGSHWAHLKAPSTGGLRRDLISLARNSFPLTRKESLHCDYWY